MSENSFAMPAERQDEKMKIYRLQNRVFCEKTLPDNSGTYFELTADLERETFPFATTHESIKGVRFRVPNYQIPILLNFNGIWYDAENNRFAFVLQPGNIVKEDEINDMVATELSGQDRYILAERLRDIAAELQSEPAYMEKDKVENADSKLLNYLGETLGNGQTRIRMTPDCKENINRLLEQKTE